VGCLQQRRAVVRAHLHQVLDVLADVDWRLEAVQHPQEAEERLARRACATPKRAVMTTLLVGHVHLTQALATETSDGNVSERHFATESLMDSTVRGLVQFTDVCENTHILAVMHVGSNPPLLRRHGLARPEGLPVIGVKAQQLHQGPTNQPAPLEHSGSKSMHTSDMMVCHKNVCCMHGKDVGKSCDTCLCKAVSTYQ